ncbi:hypothetical protein KIN20_016907 [Parelaphostrongylus tenuis]|uniref:AD domain-containing protein n=1 Tax=Parelaphostrongylus tenuis TaxID=148309 RepID=A0AAD5N083_PARTN|nr:hypothetical protein KIN20_016907 [Parelaphostrongylus tenuis]
MESAPSFTWIAHPVRVHLSAGAREPSVDGNLYTVDPVTGSLVLVQFRNKSPCKLVWIPRESYISASMLENPSEECAKHSVELVEMMENMFGMRKVDDPITAELGERRDRLLKWLRANHVEVMECDDGSLLIFGAARIESPFTEDSCFCDNAIILKRLRGLVSKVPK